jgi:hypothetical protein
MDGKRVATDASIMEIVSFFLVALHVGQFIDLLYGGQAIHVDDHLIV